MRDCCAVGCLHWAPLACLLAVATVFNWADGGRLGVLGVCRFGSRAGLFISATRRNNIFLHSLGPAPYDCRARNGEITRERDSSIPLGLVTRLSNAVIGLRRYLDFGNLWPKT